MTDFKISYKDMAYHKMFKTVDRDEAIEMSSKENFKCYQTLSTPNKNHRTGERLLGRRTQIRMVTIRSGNIEYNKWNG